MVLKRSLSEEFIINPRLRGRWDPRLLYSLFICGVLGVFLYSSFGRDSDLVLINLLYILLYHHQVYEPHPLRRSVR
jgi:hypothetical protein